MKCGKVGGGSGVERRGHEHGVPLSYTYPVTQPPPHSDNHSPLCAWSGLNSHISTKLGMHTGNKWLVSTGSDTPVDRGKLSAPGDNQPNLKQLVTSS